MPLFFEQQVETDLPLDLRGLIPSFLLGKTKAEIAKTPLRLGRQAVLLGELFRVSGSLAGSGVAGQRVVFGGRLAATHWIGAGLDGGEILVEGSCGRHLGDSMNRGRIEVAGSAGDFAGSEMTGGRLIVSGSAGDYLGAAFSGAKTGMNRGEILVQGDVGSNCGRGLRRGTIVIGGDAGDALAANMKAGTVLVFGEARGSVGAEMVRGTIALLGGNAKPLLPTFLPGMTAPVPVFRLLHKWLADTATDVSADVSSRASSQWPAFAREKLLDDFQCFHGDSLQGGRGEVFIRR